MMKNITAPRLWLVIAKSYRVLSLLAEQSIANTGLCLTDFVALEALLHKGPLTISEIQDKVRLASGSMTAAVDRLARLGFVLRTSSPRTHATWTKSRGRSRVGTQPPEKPQRRGV